MKEEEQARTPEQLYLDINKIDELTPIVHSFMYLGKNVTKDIYGIQFNFVCPHCQEIHTEVIKGLTPGDAFANAIHILEEVIEEFSK